jgi:IMP dehydrogenase
MKKYKLVEINSIEKEKFSGDVYDIEVEDDHSFTVNGIAVHNSACMTRRNTGVGVPALYAAEVVLEEIRNMNPRPKLILDGGIKFSGDVSKALKFADAVMLGSYISGTTETPGQVFKDENDKHYKVYMGSASGENKVANGQTGDYVEGVAMKVPFRGHVKYILKDLKECVQSAFSYTNSRTLDDFHNNCEFIEITGGGKSESKI